MDVRRPERRGLSQPQRGRDRNEDRQGLHQRLVSFIRLQAPALVPLGTGAGVFLSAYRASASSAMNEVTNLPLFRSDAADLDGDPNSARQNSMKHLLGGVAIGA